MCEEDLNMSVIKTEYYSISRNKAFTTMQ